MMHRKEDGEDSELGVMRNRGWEECSFGTKYERTRLR